MSESLWELLGELHAERERSWLPEDLAINISQRRELVETFDAAMVKGVGHRLKNFEFLDVEGGRFTLDDLVTNGPAVIIIFRYATCPSCNIALPYYRRNLWPRLRELGLRLVAVSQQVPERLREIRTAHGLEFTVASDPDSRFSNHLGLTWSANAAVQGWLTRNKVDLPAILGTTSGDLPHTTALVIDRNRAIAFIDVTPDWLKRTEAGTILEAVSALTQETDA